MIYGIPTDIKNPEFDKETFKAFIPEYSDYVDSHGGNIVFENYYKVSNARVRKNIFGDDWEYAISLCIAHYIDMQNKRNQQSRSLSSLSENSGIKGNEKAGSRTVFSYNTSNKPDSLFWNNTVYGQTLYTLMESKFNFTVFVG